MKQLYAVLCILGVVLPYLFFVPYLLSHGLDLRLFFSQLFANQISAFFAADVFVSTVVLWAFAYSESKRMHIRWWWLAVVASLVVGVSLGLPLFLLLREVEIERGLTNIKQIPS